MQIEERGQKSILGRRDSKCKGPEAEVSGIEEEKQGGQSGWNRIGDVEDLRASFQVPPATVLRCGCSLPSNWP